MFIRRTRSGRRTLPRCCFIGRRWSGRGTALIIADDNLVDQVSAGVIAAGIQVPKDIDVVAHCNYPQLPVKVFPMRLLGFDCQEGLRMATDHVRRIQEGKATPRLYTVTAKFEEEMVHVSSEDEAGNVKSGSERLYSFREEKKMKISAAASPGILASGFNDETAAAPA